MEIYFDGYCPESLLKGRQVEMRLNEDDFWESEATGLQITVFPPYATILRWRGKGKFRQSDDLASNSLKGLVMAKAQTIDGNEIFPDKECILGNNFALEWYLDEIYKSKDEFDAKKFNPNDPVFEEQKEYMNSLSSQELHKLFTLYDKLRNGGYQTDFMRSDVFQQLHRKIYELRLIFDFKWMAWHTGWKTINDRSFDYSTSSLLEISMYLTAIFRADRFSDGLIQQHFRNGTLDKIISRLKGLSQPT